MRCLVLAVAVLSVVFNVGLTQSRGSSRYIPPADDYDADDTLRIAPPTRTSSRRHRTTPVPNIRTEEEPQTYNEPATTGRRTSSRRVPTHQAELPVVRDPVPLYVPTVENAPVDAPPEPEDRPQNRRRRPKKRRRPQGGADFTTPEKQGIPIADDGRSSIRDLIDEDQKRPRVIHHSDGKTDPSEEPQFFRPPSNRLPPVRHQEHPMLQPEKDPGQPYDIRSEYTPVLPHVTSDEGSRLPPPGYSNERDPLPQNLHSNEHSRLPPIRGHQVANTPESDRREIVRNIENNLLKNTQSQAGVHSDRLPAKEQPVFAVDQQDSKYPFQPPGVEYGVEHDRSKYPESQNPPSANHADSYSNPSNRLPNPSDVRYESVNPSNEYAPYEHNVGAQNLPRGGSEPVSRQLGSSQRSRNSINSYDSENRGSSRKPQEISNERSTRYQTPIQSIPPRHQPEAPSRSRHTSRIPETTTEPPRSRSRSSSRYQPAGREELPPRLQADAESLPRYQTEKVTRGPPHRYQPDVSDEAPDRTRGISRNRDASRHPPSPNERPRESNRPLSPKPVTYAPTEAPQRTRYTRPQSEDEVRDDTASLRHTLRTRPQYDAIQSYSLPETVDDSEEYAEAPRHQIPVTPEPRSRHRPQPQYQPPRDEYTSSPRQRPPQYQPTESTRTDRQHEPTPPRRQNHPPPQPSSTARQQPQQNRRPQATNRPQEPDSQPRQNPGSRFACPDAYGFFGDRAQCDKYYECRNGTAYESLCDDGLAFNDISAPKYLRCDSLRDVDCNSRPKLQEARSTKNCPRRYGLYPHEEDCTKFWNCVDGVATVVQCPPGLTFNDDRATCDWADLVKSSCKTEELLGFTCPEATAFDLQDGVYTRYAHPTNCQLHFTCIKGEDGQRRPRMLSCGYYQVFDEASGTCRRPDDVPGCEDFFGERRPNPRRQPTREPEYEPEPETPKPRKRNQNRRLRN